MKYLKLLENTLTAKIKNNTNKKDDKDWIAKLDKKEHEEFKRKTKKK